MKIKYTIFNNININWINTFKDPSHHNNRRKISNSKKSFPNSYHQKKQRYTEEISILNEEKILKAGQLQKSDLYLWYKVYKQTAILDLYTNYIENGAINTQGKVLVKSISINNKKFKKNDYITLSDLKEHSTKISLDNILLQLNTHNITDKNNKLIATTFDEAKLIAQNISNINLGISNKNAYHAQTNYSSIVNSQTYVITTKKTSTKRRKKKKKQIYPQCDNKYEQQQKK